MGGTCSKRIRQQRYDGIGGTLSMSHTDKITEAPDDLAERDRIIMQAICAHDHPSMSLYDLGFGGTKWAKAFARVRKRFSIQPALGRKRYCTPDEKTKEMMREAMSDGKSIRITRLQYTVLRGLSSGAMTSDTLANSLKLPRTTVMSMVRKLRDIGLASQRYISGKLYLYELTAPYHELEKKNHRQRCTCGSKSIRYRSLVLCNPPKFGADGTVSFRSIPKNVPASVCEWHYY